ncbi:hypothetical protein HY412_01340 [Candidatus Kaiserbacteria bacterium]|nr:hypothetical protein [Candidatus Kaiserbacteria bacterium]
MDGNGQISGSGGNWSIVGNFNENGLNVNNWNGNRNDNVGCGAARQSLLYPKEVPRNCAGLLLPLFR